MRDKEGHLKMTNGSIHQEGITMFNVNACNNRASGYMERKLTTEIDKYIVIWKVQLSFLSS